MTNRVARDRILARLHAAPGQHIDMPDTASFYAQFPGNDAPTRVERLVLNLKNAMAEVHRTSSASLANNLAQLIQSRALGRVAVGTDVLAQSALKDALASVCTLHPVQSVHGEQNALFDQVDAGLTLSHASIAETGTIVLWSSPQSPRLLSLVPPVHIVIVDATKVHDTFFDLLQHEQWAQGLPTNVIMVSSPSKTADIQQTLAYGAHGPKQLIVILVEVD